MTASVVFRNWRASLNMTQSAMARWIGVSQSTLCEWEKGTRAPGLRLALIIERKSGGSIKVSVWAKNKRRVRRRPARTDMQRLPATSL